MNLEEWIRILFTYGPFAILILLVFVVERMLYSRMKHAAQAQRKCSGYFMFRTGLRSWDR